MATPTPVFRNPFRPGAGHMPPYLAGRKKEEREFIKLLDQDPILANLVLTGLRGVGKTVLLDTFKPIAMDVGWLWVGTDWTESTSVSEENMALRLMTDLSVVTSSIIISADERRKIGFKNDEAVTYKTLNFEALANLYNETPGIVSDKIKNVLETVWSFLKRDGRRGVIFAYDEAQNLSDQKAKDQYPLSLLLDVFQSIQKKGIPFMLVLTGLPTLFLKLVEARTFAERMFEVVMLERLNEPDSRDAIVKPTEHPECKFKFKPETVERMYKTSGGYPFFIQFICREVFDAWIQNISDGKDPVSQMSDIVRKLDVNFFSGRWGRATDRQRELLEVIAHLPNSDSEFTVQEVVEKSKEMSNPFGSSHTNQMLSSLCDAGLIFKNRYGKYSFAVPLLGEFILRQIRGK